MTDRRSHESWLGPCIEYVPDSLICHGIRQVKYDTDGQALPEDKRSLQDYMRPLSTSMQAMRMEGGF